MLSADENALEAALLMPPTATRPPTTPAPMSRLRRVRSSSGSKGLVALVVPVRDFVDEPVRPCELNALCLPVRGGCTRLNEEALECAWLALPLRLVGRAFVVGVFEVRFCGTVHLSVALRARFARAHEGCVNTQGYCDI